MASGLPTMMATMSVSFLFLASLSRWPGLRQSRALQLRVWGTMGSFLFVLIYLWHLDWFDTFSLIYNVPFGDLMIL